MALSGSWARFWCGTDILLSRFCWPDFEWTAWQKVFASWHLNKLLQVCSFCFGMTHFPCLLHLRFVVDVFLFSRSQVSLQLG